MDRLEPIWEDPHGLAVNKPPGLLTQPRGPHDAGLSLEKLVRQYLRPDAPERVYLGTVHRLDRPVSGVILWAKNPRAAHRWAIEFQKRRARKEYWALAAPEPGSTPIALRAETWTDWLLPPDQAGRAQVVPSGSRGALEAVTEVEPGPSLTGPNTGAGWVWLKLRPSTGRTHQLRAQAAARGWPIVGDAAYGSTESFEAGIALHARTLAIPHPILRSPLVLEAPLPPSWLGLIPGS